MQKYSIIRTIYLYLFACLGLILLTIGGVRFVDMGLKAFIFTKADQEQRIYQDRPLMPPYPVEKIKEIEKNLTTEKEEIKLTEEEKSMLKSWLVEYEKWEKQYSNFDPITARRQRDASINLAMILIGLPLYLYHWEVIKRETKENNNTENKEEN